MAALDLVFLGTPDFALPTLSALLASQHRVRCVYTQPPRPAGRGQQERPAPVATMAGARGIPLRTPARFSEPDAVAAFRALSVDAAVVVAYGLLLPAPVLETPRFGCLNIHASLLPRWRGAAPIQRAIMAGDSESGVTIMRLEAGLDTGPILLSQAIPIDAETTGGALHDRLATLGAPLLLAALDGVASGRLNSRPQPEAGVTYAGKIGRDDLPLDWRRPAVELERQVRALAPAPGATCRLAGEVVKVFRAALEPGAAAPGTVLDERLLVACGSGALRLLEVQRPSRRPLPAAEFLRGRAVASGASLV
ncbi:MAG: methionyl-tRNA formyltransferase [Alphaproteobacteria bacterium]|nr:methionyl-tRNA formyltransferase [Alphaproteobacteria bacterium]